MVRWILAPLVFVLAACPPPKPARTQPAPVVTVADVERVEPPAVAPAQPTLRLPANFTPTGYAARLVIDPDRPTFDGEIEIAGDVTERSAVIWLHGRHLTIARAVARGAGGEVAIAVTPRGDDLLELRPATPLAAGAWTLALAYAGEVDSINTAGAFRQEVAGKRYVFTQLEAIYARRVFPCVDEPDRKVPWRLALDVPAGLVAVSNTPVASETALDAGHKRVTFAPTKPLPSYLVAFAVGPFEVIDAGKSRTGTPLRVLTLAGRAAEGAWAAKTVAPLVGALEDWFGTPYPYEKLDVISIPITVGFGAMENAGLITFTETLILVDPVKASREREHRWVSVAAHELAHQWFGNLVTMKFWDDIWLNEGFATWMASKVTGAVDRGYRDELHPLGIRNRALDADALVNARQIRQPIESPHDIANAFDRITYDKGASVLAMFEHYVGAAKFQQGVRAYLAKRAFGNATSRDFIAAIVEAAGDPRLDPAFASFLDQPGAPALTATIACAKGAKPALELAQHRYVPPGSTAPAAARPWTVPVCVAYDKDGARAETCTLLDATSARIELDARACPRWAMSNVDGRGYYRTTYTTRQVTALRDEAWRHLTWTERRAVFFDVATGFTDGELPLQLALSFVPRMLAGNDRFTIAPAIELVTDLDRRVPDPLRGKYEHWLRATFGPGAAAVGLVPRSGDTLDVEETREALLDAVALRGRDPALLAEAAKLADHWRELPQAVRGLVLALAVDQRPELFDRVLGEIGREPDRRLRGEMYDAVAAVRDPARQARALALILDKKLDIRESIDVLHGWETDANLAVAQRFFRDHEAEILARMPSDETAAPLAELSWLFAATCRADQRDAMVAYIERTFAKLPGGPRITRQAIEGMDQCIARRKLLEPELRAWLAGLRLPKKR